VHKVFSITNQPLAQDQLAAFFFLEKFEHSKFKNHVILEFSNRQKSANYF
jgi:hypothetical protein